MSNDSRNDNHYMRKCFEHIFTLMTCKMRPKCAKHMLVDGRTRINII